MYTAVPSVNSRFSSPVCQGRAVPADLDQELLPNKPENLRFSRALRPPGVLWVILMPPGGGPLQRRINKRRSLCPRYRLVDAPCASAGRSAAAIRTLSF